MQASNHPGRADRVPGRTLDEQTGSQAGLALLLTRLRLAVNRGRLHLIAPRRVGARPLRAHGDAALSNLRPRPNPSPNLNPNPNPNPSPNPNPNPNHNQVALRCPHGVYVSLAAALCDAMSAKLTREMTSLLRTPALFSHTLNE